MNNQDILKTMNLDKQAKLFVGKSFWELEKIENKNIFLSDGPHGIRKEVFDKKKKTTVPAICYPAACLSACSFDKNLIQELGQELAKECIEHDIDVLLGPGINIKRNPLCGRNFEYFSEDPFLTGTLASSYIEGVQSKHVGVSLKHFACNSQEQARFINDSIVDQRTLREIYLKAFEIAIKKSKPWMVMASYNKVNGVHTTEDPKLLTDILRNEFGFDGVVVSDWGALNNPLDAIKAGLDLEMPGVSKGAEYLIKEAVLQGKLDAKVLEESTKRKIDLFLKTKEEKTKEFEEKHALSLAKKINDQSIVLLKNEDDILPLKEKQTIALIGELNKNPRIQGGGSSNINALGVTNLFDEFKEHHLNFVYAPGYELEKLKVNSKLIEEAVLASKDKDVVIITCGLPRIIESEGYDRDNLEIPEAQLKLIEEISKVNKNIVIVLQNGSPIEMPFIDKTKGLIEAYLGGSMWAKSVYDILFGHVNPSGRLAETFPLRYQDVPSSSYYLENPFYSLYKEGIYVGYRYYDTFNKKVLFPFGYGLSYSKVTYSPLEVRRNNDEFICSFKVTNESDRFVQEVVEIYGGELNPTIYKAKKELMAFDKVNLEPHETKEVSLTIKLDQLKYYSNQLSRWNLEGGTYRFYLAKHVMDESNYFDFEVESNDTREDLRKELPFYYDNQIATNEEFEKVIGRKLDLVHKVKPYTLESPICDIEKSFLGFIIFKPLVSLIINKIVDPVEKKMYRMSIPYQPIRSLQAITSLSKYNIEGILDIFSHHFFRGVKKILSKDKVIK